MNELLPIPVDSRFVMRRLLCFAVALAALVACAGQQYAPDTSPVAPEGSSTSLDSLLATSITDAGASTAGSSHALTITRCASSPEACAATDSDAAADAPTEEMYRVVFGSGRGVMRTRTQAMADLYNELRDRIASGERLDAEPLSLRDAGRSRAKTALPDASVPSSDDPIAKCAFRLLEIADGAGAVALDVLHGTGVRGCTLSLGSAVERGDAECIVKEPERPRRMGR